jgi:hypothetical protein
MRQSRRRNRAIYGDAMIPRKIDLCGGKGSAPASRDAAGMLAAGYDGGDHPGAPAKQRGHGIMQLPPMQ